MKLRTQRKFLGQPTKSINQYSIIKKVVIFIRDENRETYRKKNQSESRPEQLRILWVIRVI